MKAGETKTFPLQFPADYQGKDVAGKEADFLVTLKKIEAQHLPEVNEALAKSLGIKDGTVEALRADIKRNLEREVKFRVLARNKASVMDALVKVAELDVPKALVAGEVERMTESARADLKKRGIKDADNAPIPAEIFQPQAERRVRLGLVVGELVRANNLQAKPDQLQAHIEEMAQSYEKPGRGGALVPGRPPAHGRGRGRGDREQRGRVRAGQGQGHRQGGAVRRTDGRLTRLGQTREQPVTGRRAARPAPRAASAGPLLWPHNQPRYPRRPHLPKECHERAGHHTTWAWCPSSSKPRAAASAPTTSTAACCASASSSWSGR